MRTLNYRLVTCPSSHNWELRFRSWLASLALGWVSLWESVQHCVSLFDHDLLANFTRWPRIYACVYNPKVLWHSTYLWYTLLSLILKWLTEPGSTTHEGDTAFEKLAQCFMNSVWGQTCWIWLTALPFTWCDFGCIPYLISSSTSTFVKGIRLNVLAHEASRTTSAVKEIISKCKQLLFLDHWVQAKFMVTLESQSNFIGKPQTFL